MLTLLLVMLAAAPAEGVAIPPNPVEAAPVTEAPAIDAPATDAAAGETKKAEEPAAAPAEAAPAPTQSEAPPAAESAPADSSQGRQVEVPVAPDGTVAAPAEPPAAEEQKPKEKTLGEKEVVVEVDEVRFSLPTEGDADAWAGEGLRIAIGYGYNIVNGTAPAWSYRAHGFLLRPQVRIDERWALGGSFQYAFGDGISWAANFEPTFYPIRQLGLSLGIGYAGQFVFRDGVGFTGEPDDVASRTLTDGRALSSCEGSGVSGLGRAEYLMVVGPHFATGPFAQANVQWTACETDLAQGTDPETGKPLIGTQWWRQQGATLGWWLTWR